MSMDITFIEGDPPPTERDLADLRLQEFSDELKKRPGIWAVLPKEISREDADIWFRGSSYFQLKKAGDGKFYVRKW